MRCTATASASPITSAAVVLAVGARLCGQASFSTLMSRQASDCFAREDSRLPLMVTRPVPMRLTMGRMVMTSEVSPELEMTSATSSGVIMPRSPWLASPGWTKNAGVPVLASVEAILPPTWPDLPMPITTTRPRQFRSISQAAANSGPMRAASAVTACASISITERAWSMALCGSIVNGGGGGRQV